MDLGLDVGDGRPVADVGVEGGGGILNSARMLDCASKSGEVLAAVVEEVPQSQPSQPELGAFEESDADEFVGVC